MQQFVCSLGLRAAHERADEVSAVADVQGGVGAGGAEACDVVRVDRRERRGRAVVGCGDVVEYAVDRGSG